MLEIRECYITEFWNTIRFAFNIVGSWTSRFLGRCDGPLYTLIAFVVVDYVTCVMCAVISKKLPIEMGLKWICQKASIFLLVGIANILGVHVICDGSVLRSIVIFFYTSVEGMLILKNARHLGLPIPKKLEEILLQFRDISEEDK